ncbi:MAG TPA: squalene synthase HpnC [Ignavibacteria bacterium]|nr:squalene synthase HpnC [Ignavibacteria bacterium]HRF67100.1 squalene synthase HpnC [Ignavibacteria bacterium]HRJ05158.1 squalene synthase HpnC [Ignavibacteria bacterium]
MKNSSTNDSIITVNKDELYNSSFKYCEDIAKGHYENFPVASLLLPKDKRKYVYAIYAFARAADDFADEEGIEGGAPKRVALLDEWNQKLKDCYNGKAYDPIFIALGKTVQDCRIPIKPLEDLLSAFKQDVVKSRYNTFDEVLDYCTRSANPVGRLVLMIFGCHDDEFFKYSDKICTALQLTNFWQDVEVDLRKDRIYLPEEDIKQFGYSYRQLEMKQDNENFRVLMKYEAERTQAIFDEGKKLIEMTAGNADTKKLSKELKLTWLGGTTILAKIKEIDYNVLNQRPTISGFDKLRIFLGSRF